LTISVFFTLQSPTKLTKRNKEQKGKPQQQQQTPRSLFEQKSFKTLVKEMDEKQSAATQITIIYIMEL
jgi:hypothetical protein